MNKTIRILFQSIVGATLILALASCGGNKTTTEKNSQTQPTTALAGKIAIDGSSTVYPITAAVAEEFMKKQRGVEMSVASAGTGGGMKKFAAGEIDIVNASRKIKDSEAEQAKKNSIEYTELMVAYDGISVVVNKTNNWLTDITTEDLNKIWNENSTVKTWKDVNPAWPGEPIKLYGPGTDSGTFDYFTEEINKKAKSMRKDFTPSEDDNVLVKGVEGDKNAMGYFGYAYYVENKDNLKLLSVNGVAPGEETIKTGTYKPLSRPLFIYVNNKSMAKPEVKEFLKYYFAEGKEFVKSVGYVPLDEAKYKEEAGKIK